MKDTQGGENRSGKHNLEVAGSNPVPATENERSRPVSGRLFSCAHILKEAARPAGESVIASASKYNVGASFFAPGQFEEMRFEKE